MGGRAYGGAAGGGGGAGAGVACCGVSYGGGGGMSWAGNGQGEYVAETTYRYVGCGGDYDTGKPRDFTCVVTGGSLCALLLLIPLLIWLCWPDPTTSEPYNCRTLEIWPADKIAYCCANYGLQCPTTETAPPTTQPPTTQPPTTRPTTPWTHRWTTRPPPTPCTMPPGPVDPYNCAVDPRQECLVLPNSPFGLPRAAHNTASSRSIQLRGRLLKLASWLVCRQEGLVLPTSQQGLP